MQDDALSYPRTHADATEKTLDISDRMYNL